MASFNHHLCVVRCIPAWHLAVAQLPLFQPFLTTISIRSSFSGWHSFPSHGIPYGTGCLLQASEAQGCWLHIYFMCLCCICRATCHKHHAVLVRVHAHVHCMHVPVAHGTKQRWSLHTLHYFQYTSCFTCITHAVRRILVYMHHGQVRVGGHSRAFPVPYSRQRFCNMRWK